MKSNTKKKNVADVSEFSLPSLKKSFDKNLHFNLAKDAYTMTQRDEFMALAIGIRDRLVKKWVQTQQTYHKDNPKRVYYLSMEFLIGRLLSNNLINLDLVKEAKSVAKELNVDFQAILDEERDAGLGNGGLGRLAACFLDSLATLKIPAHGYGIRYEYGIFKQQIEDGFQVEIPDEWLKRGNPWEFARPEYSVRIQFNGHVEQYHDDKDGKIYSRWLGTDDVVAMPYDTPISGYQNDAVNTLRLWSAQSSEKFGLDYFNDGDYEQAVYHKIHSETISKVLYPNDSTAFGRELRLKQEYFFTAASIADIVRRFKKDNKSLKDFPKKVAIQLNDTHPALAVAEFMRVLLDLELLDWEDAWKITIKTFAYTNHTLMPEALETWSLPLMEKLLPRHLQIIYEINARFLETVKKKFPSDKELLQRVSLIEESDPKRVRMAFLAIVGSHAINGVSELHSQLITERLFQDFYKIFPERFQNKTNGVTPRQWLVKANPNLSKVITEAIGEGWKKNFSKLSALEKYATDSAFQSDWQKVKRKNKESFAEKIYQEAGVRVSPDSLFDVQIKRIHEYKRQTLFAFYVVSEYLKIVKSGIENSVPRTFIFSGKAAPGYVMAKLIIKFIHSIAEIVNHDPKVKDQLKVVFLKDYRVSLAEHIFPASDLSEQISTAGTEASGTGCMKFMMNGALTIGTWDGANIEMAAEGGAENFFIFGLRADQVQRMKAEGYSPKSLIKKSEKLMAVFDFLLSGFSPEIRDSLKPLFDNLWNSDPFLVCADFDEYVKTQEIVSKNYKDQADWTKKAILNVSRSGKFSSDRTIKQYADEIWKVPYAKK